MTIREIEQGLKNKKFSVLEIAKFYLNKKDKVNAFITRTKELAILQAKKKKDNNDLLSKIPYAVKDNIMVKGVKTTCASKALKDYRALYSATCVERINGIVLGKTNLDEFAMGSSTETSFFHTTKNPHDFKRVPGGSSGGSAAAVAADLAPYAIGSDTGGSIRLPASFCGVVGLKPTYGAVSRYGLVAFASSLDQIGPLTKTVEDAEFVFNKIAHKDKKDLTSLDRKFIKKKKTFKIGLPKEYFISGIDPEVKKAIEKAIQGLKTEKISLPNTKYALASYYIISTAEASANLARFDGIRYGNKAKAKDLLSFYLKTRAESFGQEVKRRIMLGTFSLSSGYYDAYYNKAQKVRELITEDFKKVFQKFDFIITPTSPSVAFKIGEKKDPISMYLSDIFTVSVNLAGLPAISIPVGKSNNLPIGLQIIGKPFDEENIFQLAKLIEKKCQR
ncbi:MAG: Asp-tRNA(Asn)/Glu-tRNA(Gln) amidotransferase subunit GatA [Candidatus Pacebacteria bacterium]|nr:Asp-tRNA(Asn)/Glu-tRNA(Gln) amidotransferase subunit GatA [Candidatus Paceibacterota bacterium]